MGASSTDKDYPRLVLSRTIILRYASNLETQKPIHIEERPVAEILLSDQRPKTKDQRPKTKPLVIDPASTGGDQYLAALLAPILGTLSQSGAFRKVSLNPSVLRFNALLNTDRRQCRSKSGPV